LVTDDGQRAPVHVGPYPLDLPKDLKGRRAVVTGAARGIGQSIAEWLVQAEADVVAVDKDEIALEQSLNATGCQTYKGDLSGEDIDELAEGILRNGPVELIVNNVGVTTPKSFLNIEPAELDQVWRANVRGPWLLTRALVEALLKARANEQRRPPRRGSILFISSLHDRHVTEEAHYAATKAAVAAFSRSLAKQLAPDIRVNTISPGAIRTAPNPKSPEQRRKYSRLRRRIPLGQAGVPADIARTAIFLLSDAWSGYTTGQNIDVDGGLSLHNWRDD
jgi:NAD(P)-dependent dehydrogenase (short-subunit alcohol dehydrogenase family)